MGERKATEREKTLLEAYSLCLHVRANRQHQPTPRPVRREVTLISHVAAQSTYLQPQSSNKNKN